jgi:hypothetical protein
MADMLGPPCATFAGTAGPNRAREFGYRASVGRVSASQAKRDPQLTRGIT